MYSVDLDLSKEQVKRMKQLALDRDLPVRGLVTELVVEAIKDVPVGKNPQESKKKNKKEETKA